MKIIIAALLIGAGAGLTLLADIFLKKSDGFTWNYFLAGLALYALVAFPVAMAFKLVEFGSLFVIWEALYLILGLVVGSLLFGELFTLQKGIAAVLMLAAILLVNL